MKRSEMIDAIKGDLARMDLDFMHGRNLDNVPYHTRVEMVTAYVLFLAERYGMLPPTIQRKETHPAYNSKCEVAGNFIKIYDRNIWEPEE